MEDGELLEEIRKRLEEQEYEESSLCVEKLQDNFEQYMTYWENKYLVRETDAF